MSRNVALAAAAGLLSALLSLSVLAGVGVGAVLTYVAPLPLMMAGLGLGLTPTLVGGGLALAVVALLDGYAAIAFALAVVLPVVVIARQALLWRRTAVGDIEWYPPGLVLGWLTAVALALLVAAPLLSPSHDEGLRGLIRDHLDQGLTAMEQMGLLSGEMRQVMVAQWVPLFPAMLAGSWLVMAVANAVAAQSLLVRLKRNRRPTPVYLAFVPPDWLAGALAVGVGMALVGDGDFGYVAVNAVVTILVPYLFLGLAGIHRKLREQANGALLLPLFYAAVFFFSGLAIIVMAGVGLVRHSMTLQRRLGDRRDQEGE